LKECQPTHILMTQHKGFQTNVFQAAS